MTDDKLGYIDQIRDEWELRGRYPENAGELAEFAVEALASGLAKARLADEIANVIGELSRIGLHNWEREWIDRYDAITGTTQEEG